MFKAVLHALASSECTEAPFLVVLILSIWEDTPWNSAAIRGRENMSTLIEIPAGHMRFVPAHKQPNEATSNLSPAKWPVEFVLIANEKGRESFLSHGRIQKIPAPANHATCRLAPTRIRFFPTYPPTGSMPEPRKAASHSMRPVYRRPATAASTTPLGPFTPPRGVFHDANIKIPPTLGHIQQYTLSNQPLKIAELYGSLTTGLEVFLKVGFAIAPYT